MLSFSFAALNKRRQQNLLTDLLLTQQINGSEMGATDTSSPFTTVVDNHRPPSSPLHTFMTIVSTSAAEQQFNDRLQPYMI